MRRFLTTLALLVLVATSCGGASIPCGRCDAPATKALTRTETTYYCSKHWAERTASPYTWSTFQQYGFTVRDL